MYFALRPFLTFLLQDEDLSEIHRIFAPQQLKENDTQEKNKDSETKQTDAPLEGSLNISCEQSWKEKL